MAKQRYINTRFWSDSFITELNPLDRYLFLYFLTNEHTNIAGIYELPLKVISFETGLELDMLKKMLKRLDGKIYYIDGWVYIKNFERHQSVNDSIIKGIEVAKKEVPPEIMKKIDKIGQGVDSLGTASPHDPTYSNTNTNINNIRSEAKASGKILSQADKFPTEEIDKIRTYFSDRYFEKKGFKYPQTSIAKDRALVIRYLKIPDKPNTKELINFFVGSEKFEKHASLSACLSADTIRLYLEKINKKDWRNG